MHPIPKFHGKADPIVPLNGSSILGFPDVASYTKGWVERNGIPPTAAPTVSYTKGTVTCNSWGTGESNVTVCLADGAGHSWPGSTAPLACPDSGPFACTKDVHATSEVRPVCARARVFDYWSRSENTRVRNPCIELKTVNPCTN